MYKTRETESFLNFDNFSCLFGIKSNELLVQLASNKNNSEFRGSHDHI